MKEKSDIIPQNHFSCPASQRRPPKLFKGALATPLVPVTDTRAKRLLYGESHHFSRDEMNVLVVDVTKIVTSLNAWSHLIARCFQPEQNRRFGAVVLFKSGMTGEKLQ